ncbi:hypothetical protein WA158_002866 [Blastocystis sp. Blastoise]
METVKTEKNDLTGLRHCSQLVALRLKQMKEIPYNEFSIKLIAEIQSTLGKCKRVESHKNIRRRIYDSINVLIALNVVEKTKDKLLIWKGFHNESDYKHQKLLTSISYEKQKLQQLNSKILVQMLYRRLLQRHLYEQEKKYKNMDSISLEKRKSMTSIQDIPCLFLTTSQNNDIDCEITNDNKTFYFHSDTHCVYYNDMDILLRKYPEILDEFMKVHKDFIYDPNNSFLTDRILFENPQYSDILDTTSSSVFSF